MTDAIKTDLEERGVAAGPSRQSEGNDVTKTAAPQATGQQNADHTLSPLIGAGDLVIIFLSRDRTPVPLTVTPGHELVNNFGSFPHDDMVGLPFGAKLASRNRKGFIHLLRPTPELWTLALPHRTQILYTPDMSFIAAHLGLTPGARLIEAGTGSGSFSHYATRCVARKHAQAAGFGWSGPASVRNDRSRGQRSGGGDRERRDAKEADADESRAAEENSEDEEQEKREPADAHEEHVLQQLRAEPDTEVAPRQGRVWSFEFHAGRALKAWDEFNYHGLFPTLSLRHRNVVKQGFGLQDAADAIFLDLPAPWDALPHAARAMRRTVAGRICCFSPCVEQVLRTLTALRKGPVDEETGDEARWVDIETYECLNRTHISLWCGPGTPCPITTIDDAIQRIRQTEHRKGKRREIQIERARKEFQKKRANGADDADTSATGTPTMTDVDEDGSAAVESKDGDDGEDDDEERNQGQKRKRDEESEGSDGESEDDVQTQSAAKPSTGGKTLQRAGVVSRPFGEMRGHTSYLTFATLVPRIVEQQPDPTLEREREIARRKQAAAERSRLRKEANAAAATKEEDTKEA